MYYQLCKHIIIDLFINFKFNLRVLLRNQRFLLQSIVWGNDCTLAQWWG